MSSSSWPCQHGQPFFLSLLCEPIPVGLAGRNWVMEIDKDRLGRVSVDRKPQRHLLHKDDDVGVVPPVVLSSMWSPSLTDSFSRLGCGLGGSGYEKSENDICGMLSHANAWVWPDVRCTGWIITPSANLVSPFRVQMVQDFSHRTLPSGQCTLHPCLLWSLLLSYVSTAGLFGA